MAYEIFRAIAQVENEKTSKHMKTITIYWKDNGTVRDNIRKRFGISGEMSVNGENSVTVSDEELAELRKYEADGFIELRNK